MKIAAIVAVDDNWAIGKDGNLLFHIKEDMKFFRTMTTYNVVIMGRKTFESFPNGALPNRVNIVITSDKNYVAKDAYVVGSIEEAIEKAKQFNSDIFCIGGGSIYKQMLDYCDTAYVTKIYASVDGADTFFPNLDNNNWFKSIGSDRVTDEKTGVDYQFVTYLKK